MPVTISAFIIGIFVMPMITLLDLVLTPMSATQVNVPITVAAIEDTRAMDRVFAKASSIASS